MRYTNREIAKLKKEYLTADKNRKNEIFESLSYIARSVAQDIYGEYGISKDFVCTYADFEMLAYEKLHEILSYKKQRKRGDIKTRLLDACKAEADKQLSRSRLEKSATSRAIELKNQEVKDEATLCNIADGREILSAMQENFPNSKRVEVVKMYFGFGEDGTQYTLREIGNAVGLSHERVRQLVTRFNLVKTYIGKPEHGNDYHRIIKLARSNYPPKRIAFILNVDKDMAKRAVNIAKGKIEENEEN